MAYIRTDINCVTGIWMNRWSDLLWHMLC